MQATDGVGANAHSKAFGGLEGITIPDDMDAVIERRRAANPVLRLHHHAFRCRNAEETRHFYEDVLGMPLVQALMRYRDFGAPNNFLHLFFELGDGSAIAFFECTGDLVTRGFAPDSGWDHHVAFHVGSDEVIADFKKRLDAAGVPNNYIDHEVYHSLYFNDPNGLNLEFCGNAPRTDEFEKKEARVAHRDLKAWMDRVHPPKSVDRHQ